MRVLLSGMLLLCLNAGPSVADPPSVRINVSATVPPRPCEYPTPCTGTPSPQVSGSATIVGGRVLYVGPVPDVTRYGDLLTIRF